jgi:hypothetical protein
MEVHSTAYEQQRRKARNRNAAAWHGSSRDRSRRANRQSAAPLPAAAAIADRVAAALLPN